MTGANNLPGSLHSLSKFYATGPSLFRWVRYGHGPNNLDRFYVDPFSKDSLMSPSAPFVPERICQLFNPMGLPSILINRALKFRRASKYFPKDPSGLNYPGDGYLFFNDQKFSIENHFSAHHNTSAFLFYNYLYSFRHLISYNLFCRLVNLGDSVFNFLYEHRKFIFGGNVSVFKRLNSACKNPAVKKDAIVRLLLHQLFNNGSGHQDTELELPEFLDVSQIILLLDNYTLDAVKHILFGENASYQRIIRAIDLVEETCSLIEGNLQVKYSSVNALQRFHDFMSVQLEQKAIAKFSHLYWEYQWSRELSALIDSSTNGKWYLPVQPIEILGRGKAHRNCLGSYYVRHFAKPTIVEPGSAGKMLILMSKEAEAELRIYFSKQTPEAEGGGSEKQFICRKIQIEQVKTRFNKNYSCSMLENLQDKFLGMDLKYFYPVLQ